MSDANRWREMGRRGGIASGEARRKAKLRSWSVEFLAAVNADPVGFVAGILASGNGAAKVRALELAEGEHGARLLEREHDLEERDRRLRQAESALDLAAESAEFYERRRDEAQAELARLEAARSELRSMLESESAGTPWELSDDA